MNLRTDDNVHLFVEEDSTLKLRFDSVSHEGTTEEVDLFIIENSTCPWPSIKPRRIERANSDATLSAGQITRWLEHCSTNHGSMTCGYASDPKPLPTRLLQIGGHQKLRLYTPSSNERGRYVCLSHCWGGSVALQTTRATELRFHDNIDWNSLPRTFKDAVDLTWLLGLEYLWTDSLCILQNDLDDWRHEGSKMASVYSNCFITLAATTSANCNGGFYKDPDSNTANTIGKIRHESVEPFALHSQKSLQHRTFGDAELPLLGRAWAFQERLLSARVVHFADEELFCECIGKESYECGVSSSQSWYGLSKSRLTGFLSMEIPRTPTPSQTVGSMAKKWYEIVSYYLTLNLTFHTDTLPALQGIAKQMQLMRCGSYAAGLWEDTIFDDLQSYSQTRNTPKVHVYPSPSWSWASRQRSITFQQHGTHSRRLAQVMSVTITPKGLDLTGEVLAGILIISVRRARAHIGFTDEKPSKTILKVASRDGTTSASYTPVEWAKNFDITADRAMEVELLELALIDLGGDNATIFLDLRSAEHSATDDKCPTGNKIPTFERIGIGHFDIQEEAEMYLQSQPSTIRVI